jgi:hypothetical protein
MNTPQHRKVVVLCGFSTAKVRQGRGPGWRRAIHSGSHASACLLASVSPGASVSFVHLPGACSSCPT